MDDPDAPAPRLDAARDADLACAVDADCPGDPRFVRRCIGGLCADLGCNHEDARCDDGNPCTIDTCEGTLTCENRLDGVCCRSAPDCDDGDPCTTDTCEGGTCARELVFDCGPCVDADGDGHLPPRCGGDDCGDGNREVHPGAPEICTGHLDEDCDDTIDVDDLDCQPATASCDGRARLTAGAGVEGTIAVGPRRTGDCGNAAFYELPLDGESDVELRLDLDPTTPVSGTGFEVRGAELALMVESTCGDPASGPVGRPLVCDPAPSFYNPSLHRTLFVRRLPAGASFVELEAQQAVGAPIASELRFTLAASTRPAERPRCDEATVVPGTTTRLPVPTNDGLDCFGPWIASPLTRGPERVHAFTLAEPSRVVLTATPTDGSASRIGLVEACSSDVARATCEESLDARGCQTFATLDRLLPAGTHHVAVEASAPYDLTVRAEPIGDACAGAAALELDGSAATGTTTGAPDRFQYTGAAYYDRSCGSSTGPDVVHTFTLAAETEVQISPSADFDFLVRLLTGCGGDTEWASTGSMVRRLPAGTYYVVLDGADPSQHGPYSLTLTTAP